MDPRGVSENVHKPFIDSLAAIQQTLNEWDELRHKVLAQIKSLRNLQEQLEAIERLGKGLHHRYNTIVPLYVLRI